MLVNKKIFIFLIFLIVLSCKEKILEELIDKKIYPNLIQDNYKHYIYKNSKKYLFTKIDRAEFFEKTEKILCNLINAEIYNSKGELTTKINSDKGEIDQNKKIFVFSDNVVFELIESETSLYCDKIELDYENNKLYCRNDLIIEKKDGSYLKASSMESDLKLQETRFTDMKIKYFYDEEEKNKDE